MSVGSREVVVRTTTFGELHVPEEKTLLFQEGIPGFPTVHEFALLELDEVKPFQYLQSLGEPPVALLIVNPFVFAPDYRFDISARDMEDLQAVSAADVSVFAVATIPSNPAEATINLMAPVLINAKSRRGKQVILLEADHPVRHPLFGPGRR